MRLKPVIMALLAVLAPLAAWAGTLTNLHAFTDGTDGASPNGTLVPYGQGGFLGTTSYGGMLAKGQANGTIFQIVPPASGQTGWTLTTLHTFAGSDGAYPQTLLEAGGAFYGTTVSGGLHNGNCTNSGYDAGCGTVFKLVPPSGATTTWTFSVIHAFLGGARGGTPSAGLAIARNGDLYGFAGGGTCGSTGCAGIAYKLTPPAAGQTAWTESVIYTFGGGADGAVPVGAPLLGTKGTLYGVTSYGGATKPSYCQEYQPGCGTVFTLSPPASGTTWTHKVIWTFGGADGATPTGLVSDKAGHLYGDTNVGGTFKADCQNVYNNDAPSGCGTVFELTPPEAAGKPWTLATLYRFPDGAPGAEPQSAPVFNLAGDLVLTTSGNEPTTDGSVVELLKPAAGKTAWSERTLHAFTGGADAGGPLGSPVVAGGVVYGTTAGLGTGAAPYGTVFSLVP